MRTDIKKLTDSKLPAAEIFVTIRVSKYNTIHLLLYTMCALSESYRYCQNIKEK